MRAEPGNPDPALRAADLASAARRTFSLFFTASVFSQVPGNFFFAAPGHYPLNTAEVKRLRMHRAAYTRHSDTILQIVYA
ncbi:hypothetical protein [Burkholderia sp. Bp8984]|uniref:hypothetical protein n=1 Tax=Burkholderia sp. Bp8984 TaxID=2184549 RepID=UPI000F595F44|nr:hypothetical protein [Burkholderia sp. Bp8984]